MKYFSLQQLLAGVICCAVCLAAPGISLAAAGAIAESAAEISPVRVGETAPGFEVVAVDGERFSFDPLALDKPVILISFRGGWCPYCNFHLSELRQVIPEIRDLGIDVLFLSGDRPEILYASLTAEAQADIGALDYRIYSDASGDAAIALGIAFAAAERTIKRRYERGQDIKDSSMEQRGILPVPAVIAVNARGIVSYVYTNADYKVRLPAEDLLEVARSITESSR